MIIPRYWFSLYAFVLSESSLFSMMLLKGDVIRFPIRPMPDSLNMSLLFTGLVYPSLVWAYLALRGRGTWTYFGAIALAFAYAFVATTWFESWRLVDFKGWDDAEVALLFLSHLAFAEAYLRYYERMAGELR